MIQQHVIVEGNLKAVKCTDDFGGPNMWNLYLQDINGYWENVQWMDAQRIQLFFTTKLPRYTESRPTRYELA
jgi:hypothetical protein